MQERKVLSSIDQNATKQKSTAQGKTKKGSGLSPPEAPRTAFMCFMEAKQQRISEENNNSSSTQMKQNSDSYRLVAEEWRKLSHQERAIWDEAARKDKLRFAEEKAAYDGPWDLPKRRAKKHPLAPKRPMSAFLKFSQTRRKIVKSQNPDMSNTDVSRLLGEMWRNARPAERDPYVEEELKERAIYKAAIAKFKSLLARREASRLEMEKEEQNAKKDMNFFRPRDNHLSTPSYMYHQYDRQDYGHRQSYGSLQTYQSYNRSSYMMEPQNPPSMSRHEYPYTSSPVHSPDNSPQHGRYFAKYSKPEYDDHYPFTSAARAYV